MPFRGGLNFAHEIEHKQNHEDEAQAAVQTVADAVTFGGNASDQNQQQDDEEDEPPPQAAITAAHAGFNARARQIVADVRLTAGTHTVTFTKVGGAGTVDIDAVAVASGSVVSSAPTPGPQG